MTRGFALLVAVLLAGFFAFASPAVAADWFEGPGFELAVDSVDIVNDAEFTANPDTPGGEPGSLGTGNHYAEIRTRSELRVPPASVNETPPWLSCRYRISDLRSGSISGLPPGQGLGSIDFA